MYQVPSPCVLNCRGQRRMCSISHRCHDVWVRFPLWHSLESQQRVLCPSGWRCRPVVSGHPVGAKTLAGVPYTFVCCFCCAWQFGITSCFFYRQCAVYGWGWVKELTGRHSCLNFTSRHIVEPGSSEPEKCCKRQFKIHRGRNWSICAVWLCRSCWLANKIEDVVFLFFSSIVSFSFWLFVW